MHILNWDLSIEKNHKLRNNISQKKQKNFKTEVGVY